MRSVDAIQGEKGPYLILQAWIACRALNSYSINMIQISAYSDNQSVQPVTKSAENDGELMSQDWAQVGCGPDIGTPISQFLTIQMTSFKVYYYTLIIPTDPKPLPSLLVKRKLPVLESGARQQRRPIVVVVLVAPHLSHEVVKGT